MSPAPTSGTVVIGNGTSGGYGFTNINTISNLYSQYAIIQYSNTYFSGTYTTTMSYNYYFSKSGNYQLTYYIQARPRMLASNKVTWKIKYVSSHTIRANVNNFFTTNYSFGDNIDNWGVWKPQELSFRIPSPGVYPIFFQSSLDNFTGIADSAIALGAISITEV